MKKMPVTLRKTYKLLQKILCDYFRCEAAQQANKIRREKAALAAQKEDDTLRDARIWHPEELPHGNTGKMPRQRDNPLYSLLQATK